MLLAEELALVAIKHESGRHALGAGSLLDACLAGLLIGELLMNGTVGTSDGEDRFVVIEGQAGPTSPTLAAAAGVVTEKGPRIKSVLSHMSRGLQERVGAGTWDAVTGGLAAAGVVGPATGGLRSGHRLLDAGARDVVVHRLRAAAAADGPIDPRTALVLSMTGPSHLLEVVAPDRDTRKHARNRIDHALDGSNFEPLGKAVRRLIEEAAVAAIGS